MKIFKKIFTILPILSALFLCSAKDIHDSFSRYYIVVAVSDTTSLNSKYENYLVWNLRNAGHTVRLAYADSLDKDNAIGTQDWDTFDLAVIPNFVSCPTVDTTKKIGDIPVIVLEDSLWDDFGFMSSPLGTITNDDTVYISTIDDSITSVFSVGNNLVYTANSEIKGILVDSLDSWNILVKDKSQVYSVVTVDTINNVKRIAFGLPDVSKLNMYNNYYGDHAYKSKTLPTGWELFSRSIGRLVEAEKDSIFTVGMLTEGIFYYNLATTTQDSCLNTYFQTNMHRFIPTLSYYGDSSFYNADGYGWETLDLAIVSIESYDYSVTEMKSVLEANNRPLLVLGPGSSDYFFDVTRHNVGGITSITKDSVTSSNAIFDSLGIAVGDSLGLYTTTYPVIPDLGVVTSFTINDNSTVYSPLRVKRNGTYVNIMLISKEAYWVNITSPAAAYNFSLLNFSPIYKDIFEETIYYLLSSKAILPPSNVTATTLSSNSIIVTWTDNSDNETGFNIYLTPGGSYTGEDILVSTALENATSDTICGLYPPSGLFYFDVGATSTIGGSRSGSPDSAYTLPVQPARPIVYALSDTSINVLLNGYLWYDLFNDTTLASNPQWYQPYGKWNVERGYNRLRSWNVLDSTTLVGTGINIRYAATFDSAEGASIDDSGGELDSTLDLGYSDAMFSAWIYPEPVIPTSMNRIFYVKNGEYLLKLDEASAKIHTLFYSPIAGNITWDASSRTITESAWNHIVGVVDRSGKYYLFLDGVYDSEFSVTALTDSNMASAIAFQIGKLYDDYSFIGKMSDSRFYSFGDSGLTITGTHATNDLLIKLGVDTIYCQATDEGLIKQLYLYPNQTIDGTSWDNLYNADRAENFSNAAFSSNTKWEFYNSSGSGWAISGGVASVTADGNMHSIYQDPDSMALGLLDSGCYYLLEYEVTASTYAGGKFYTEGSIWAYLDQDYILDSSVGTHSFLVRARIDTQASNTQSITFTIQGGSGSLSIDNVSLKRVGEIAWWRFMESGYSDTLYDATSNDLDLVTDGDVLVSGAGYNTISSQLPDSQDIQWSFKFHFNDSLRLNKQWVKLYFNSSDSVGQANGYCLYADSSIFRVYKQTSNVYADTLIDTTWTGDYKWHTVDIEQDWQQRPIYKEINYNVYLDNALMGSFSDTTYQTQKWLVLQASHRNQWFDNFWLKNTTPGANDSAYTQYAIIDSTSGKYLQTDHTMADTAIWKTWEEWGGEDGVYIKMTPFTAKKLRVVARCKQ